MTHKILNQHGKHIIDNDLLDKIHTMLVRGQGSTTINGHIVSVRMDTRKDGDRTTTLFVQGI